MEPTELDILNSEKMAELERQADKEMNIEEAIESLNKFIKIVGSKEYRDDNGWNGYYNTEMRYLGQAIETVLADRERLITNSISKDKIRDRQMQREFELQQEYKDFEDDVEWNVYQKLLKESE